jgi:uncharacterized protein YutE (UPF0331/DUF86 family)
VKRAFNGVIQRKLAVLDSQVCNLETHLKGKSLDEFAGSWLLRSMAERALQVAAEIMIDIAERIIAHRDAGPVATAAEAMQRLVSLDVLESAEIYMGIVRLRNLIVHRYEEIDPAILYGLATSGLEDFRRFRDEIDKAAEEPT